MSAPFRIAHLRPQLGARRLAAIKNEDVQRLKHELRGKSVKTVNNVLTVLSMLLKKAVEWEVIERMPCAIRLLSVPASSVDFFDFDEYDRLAAAAKAVDWRAHLIVLLAGQAGLRSGEIRALAWTDVNPDKRQLRVERGDWRGQISTTKGGRLRYVPLTKQLVEALTAYRHLRGPLVVCRDDGRPLTENDVRAFVDRAARRAQLRQKGPHMLRHTFCFASGDERCAGQGDSGTGWTSASLHHAAVHAQQPCRDRERDSHARAAQRRAATWRHSGDGSCRREKGERLEELRW
jgi:integrase